MLRRAAFREALYHDCTDDDVALASALLAPEPSGPGNTPVPTTDERFGERPARGYIDLTEDRVVSWSLQKRMYAALPCEQVLTIDAGHSAYFSRPDELTHAILVAGGERAGYAAPRSALASVPLSSPASSMRRFGRPRSSSQRAPSRAPFSIAIVVAVPAIRHRSATTLTLRKPVTGQPVRGSSTCV